MGSLLLQQTMAAKLTYILYGWKTYKTYFFIHAHHNNRRSNTCEAQMSSFHCYSSVFFFITCLSLYVAKIIISKRIVKKTFIRNILLYSTVLRRKIQSKENAIRVLLLTDQECFRCCQVLHLQENVKELKNHL